MPAFEISAELDDGKPFTFSVAGLCQRATLMNVIDKCITAFKGID